MPLQTNPVILRVPHIGPALAAPMPVAAPALPSLPQIVVNTIANLFVASLPSVFGIGYSIGISKLFSIPFQQSAAVVLGILSISDSIPIIPNKLKFVAKQIMTLSIFTMFHYSVFSETLNLPLFISIQLTAPILFKSFSVLKDLLNNG